MGKFLKIALEYNELREENNLNATEAVLHHSNHVAEEQLDFPSLLDNLEIAYFSYKDVIQLIASNKTLT